MEMHQFKVKAKCDCGVIDIDCGSVNGSIVLYTCRGCGKEFEVLDVKEVTDAEISE